MRSVQFLFPRFILSPYWLPFFPLLLGAAVLRFAFPLAPHYDALPLLDIRWFTPSLLTGLAYGVLLCLLFGLLLWTCRRIAEADSPPGLAFLLTTTFVLGLLLLNTYPINAIDVYRYVVSGRIYSVYGESPFSTPPSAFPDDPFLPFSGEWRRETSPYGPIWELAAAGITAVTRDNLYFGLLLFKLLGLLSHLGGAALIWQLLAERPPAQRAALTLLWAWNPALLLTFVVNAHNDGLMLFWLLCGAWQMQRGAAVRGFWLLVAAVLTKPVALLALPFFFLAQWRTLPVSAARWRFLLAAGGGGLLLTVLTFWPVGSPLELGRRLSQEASQIVGFTPAALLILLNRHYGGNWAVAVVANAAHVPFVLGAVWLLWRAWHGRSPTRAAADIFGGYVLQALAFRIWYAAWLFPWTLLEPLPANGRLPYRLRAALWFLLTSQLSVIIYGHVRVFVLDESYLRAHLIGVPFTFLLPLLLAKRPFAMMHIAAPRKTRSFPAGRRR